MHTGQSLKPHATRLHYRFVRQSHSVATLRNSLLTPGGRSHAVVHCALLVIERLRNQCE